MPNIKQIKNNAKKFKKIDHRPWDESGSTKPLDAISNNPDEIINVDPSRIKRWKHKDRPENELGDINALAKEFIEIGQQQPCIVRAIENSSCYELIIGERRWQAAKIAKKDLMVIVSRISDNDAALAQIAENDSRKDLSDYAKGISFAKLISENVIKQKDLITKLGKSKQQISALLSFSKIPKEVIIAIGDMTKVSSNTAERIKELCNKGDSYINAIISIADKIRTGKFGRHAIEKTVLISLSNDSEKLKTSAKKFYSSNGDHLFTCHISGSKPLTIAFSNKYKKNINIEVISKKIINILEDFDMKK